MKKIWFPVVFVVVLVLAGAGALLHSAPENSKAGDTRETFTEKGQIANNRTDAPVKKEMKTAPLHLEKALVTATDAADISDAASSNLPPLLEAQHKKILLAMFRTNDWEGAKRYITDHGIDINSRLNDGNNYRLFECWIHQDNGIRRMEEMLDMGANFDTPDRNILYLILHDHGVESLDFIVSRAPEMLARHGKVSALFLGAQGNSEMMRALIAEGVDLSPGKVNEDDRIHFESACDDPACFAVWEAQGFRFDNRALQLALESSHLNAVKYHVENGLDLDQIFPDGDNAMDLALQYERANFTMIRYLESKGLTIEPRHLAMAEDNYYEILNIITHGKMEKTKNLNKAEEKVLREAEEIVAYVKDRLGESKANAGG